MTNLDLLEGIEGFYIGGSGTSHHPEFPQELIDLGVLERAIGIVGKVPAVSTRFGKSAPVTVLDFEGARIGRVHFHGVHSNEHVTTIWRAALQVSEVMAMTDSQWAVVDASTGGIMRFSDESQPLPPGSVMIPDDYDLFEPPEAYLEALETLFVELGIRYIRQDRPFHPQLRQYLYDACCKYFDDVEFGGSYACTRRWPLMETKREVDKLRRDGFHEVGRTGGYEIPLALLRRLPMAWANPIANFAEGVEGWAWADPVGGMETFYPEIPVPMGQAMIDAIWQILEGPPIEPKYSDIGI